MSELLYEKESYAIRGAIFEVYREMGAGFLEAVFQECLEKELALAGIPFTAQPELTLHYKGERLKQTYRADFICFEKIIIEIKAVSALAREHTAQTINYLKATGHRLAFLVNFGAHGKVHIERIVL